MTGQIGANRGTVIDDAIQARRSAELIHGPVAVASALDGMAGQAADLLAGSVPLLVSVMVGGQLPGAELARRLDFPLEMDYIHATRYKGGLRGSTLDWRSLPTLDPAGRHVLVVDDILDEGITLHEILDWFRNAGAASVHSAVLVEKERARAVEVRADIVGLKVPDRYVFGCGMDYKGFWRNLDAIYAVGEGA